MLCYSSMWKLPFLFSFISLTRSMKPKSYKENPSKSGQRREMLGTCQGHGREVALALSLSPQPESLCLMPLAPINYRRI